MKRFFGTISLVGILATTLAAQNPESPKTPGAATPPQAAGETTRIRVRVELVNVLFTVNDRKNRLVLNLSKDDLRVFEDNKPQPIRFFSRETDLPLRIAMLIDTSNSIRERLRFEQEAAIDFLTTTLRPHKDQALVVAFDVEPQLLQDYTDDMEKLSQAVRSLQAGGGTGLFDAMYFAAKEKMLFFPPPEPYLRRVMIVVSDGQDNFSEHTRDEALAMAQRGEVTIFCISTNRPNLEVGESQGKGDRVLKYLAEETGGRAFFPFSAGDLSTNFQEIARELRSQYSLAYVSTNTAHDGTYRAISIRSQDKNFRVRAKSGYFAPSR